MVLCWTFNNTTLIAYKQRAIEECSNRVILRRIDWAYCDLRSPGVQIQHLKRIRQLVFMKHIWPCKPARGCQLVDIVRTACCRDAGYGTLQFVSVSQSPYGYWCLQQNVNLNEYILTNREFNTKENVSSSQFDWKILSKPTK